MIDPPPGGAVLRGGGGDGEHVPAGGAAGGGGGAGAQLHHQAVSASFPTPPSGMERQSWVQAVWSQWFDLSCTNRYFCSYKLVIHLNMT
jgi:hypothetical protein